MKLARIMILICDNCENGSIPRRLRRGDEERMKDETNKQKEYIGKGRFSAFPLIITSDVSSFLCHVSAVGIRNRDQPF